MDSGKWRINNQTCNTNFSNFETTANGQIIEAYRELISVNHGEFNY